MSIRNLISIKNILSLHVLWQKGNVFNSEFHTVFHCYVHVYVEDRHFDIQNIPNHIPNELVSYGRCTANEFIGIDIHTGNGLNILELVIWHVEELGLCMQQFPRYFLEDQNCV